jgi:hypothetical protein
MSVIQMLWSVPMHCGSSNSVYFGFEGGCGKPM